MAPKLSFRAVILGSLLGFISKISLSEATQHRLGNTATVNGQYPLYGHMVRHVHYWLSRHFQCFLSLGGQGSFPGATVSESRQRPSRP